MADYGTRIPGDRVRRKRGAEEIGRVLRVNVGTVTVRWPGGMVTTYGRSELEGVTGDSDGEA